jgi:hypothetical protein
MPNKTLSRRKRIAYLVVCVFLFLVLSPLVAFYANGYRFGDQYQFRKTGGIYIVIEGEDYVIYLNEKEQDASSIFRRNLFIQNLRPDAYRLKVEKDMYYPWEKKVDVFSEKVADVYPFNLPKEPELIEITKYENDKNDEASSTKKVLNEEYEYVEDLFATSSARLTHNKEYTATSTEPKEYVSLRRNMLWAKNDELFVKWTGGEDNAPRYYCSTEISTSSCLLPMSVFRGAPIKTYDFLSGKDTFVIFSTSAGVYVTEIDGRGGRNIQPLLYGGSYDFRVGKNEVIYLKKDKQYFKTEVTF